jgi:transcriptional regulator of acetoin/glycerol metabolism
MGQVFTGGRRVVVLTPDWGSGGGEEKWPAPRRRPTVRAPCNLDDEGTTVILPPTLVPPSPGALARLVAESRERSLAQAPPRGAARPRRALSADDAGRRLRRGPLGRHLGLLRELLEPVMRPGQLALAVADPGARVLAVVGDDDACRRAHDVGLRAGYDWSEAAVGTNGVGTAAACRAPVRVAGRQHHADLGPELVCWAAPVRAPGGDVVGVLGLTGPALAERGQELAVLTAAAAAVEARLALEDLPVADGAAARGADPDRTDPDRTDPEGTDSDGTAVAHLRALGRRRAVLAAGGCRVELSDRHSEIVLLLAWFPGGLSAEHLAGLLERGRRDAVVVRAEVRRLREALTPLGHAARLTPRPYRFERTPTCDAARVIDLVRAGRLAEAVAAHTGGVLPGSTAPGVESVRHDVARRLRTAVAELHDAGLLLELARCPENHDDAELWGRVAGAYEPGSPGRVEALAELERIDADLRA